MRAGRCCGPPQVHWNGQASSALQILGWVCVCRVLGCDQGAGVCSGVRMRVWGHGSRGLGSTCACTFAWEGRNGYLLVELLALQQGIRVMMCKVRLLGLIAMRGGWCWVPWRTFCGFGWFGGRGSERSLTAGACLPPVVLATQMHPHFRMLMAACLIYLSQSQLRMILSSTPSCRR